MGLQAGRISPALSPAPDLFADRRGRARVLVLLSFVAGIVSLVLITTGRYRLVRVTAALAVAAVLRS